MTHRGLLRAGALERRFGGTGTQADGQTFNGDPTMGAVLAKYRQADPYGDIALLLATARETWSDEAMARQAEQQFAALYKAELDPKRQDFYLRL
jgi:hypothetical protein